MFSRVLKSTTQQPAPSTQPPTTPTKSSSRSNGHSKSQSTNVPPSPSKIPLPATPSARSSYTDPTTAKENLPAPSAQSERSNYLSFLFAQSQTGAPTTPVKVNKGTQPTAPVVHRDDKRNHQSTQSSLVPENEDVHMQTMKNTVNPAMLKSLASIPAPQTAVAKPLNPYAVQRNGQGYGSEDVYMKTAKHETSAVHKERGLEAWERELLEKADVRRKATVAQICGLSVFLLEFRLTPVLSHRFLGLLL